MAIPVDICQMQADVQAILFLSEQKTKQDLCYNE